MMRRAEVRCEARRGERRCGVVSSGPVVDFATTVLYCTVLYPLYLMTSEGRTQNSSVRQRRER